MVKYHEILFYASKDQYDVVRRALKEEFHMVGPINDPLDRTEDGMLVWEDAEKLGRYRAQFWETDDGIYFRYWDQRMTPEIEQQDPMLAAIQRTYDLLVAKPRIISPKKDSPNKGKLIDIIGRP